MINVARAYADTRMEYRLAMAIFTAIFLNGAYCLIYRYAAGNPATIAEALSWGLIHLAPWVAAIEIGRTLSRLDRLAIVLCCAAVASLALEVAWDLTMPTWFDLVRRLPGLFAAVAFLAALSQIQRRHAATSKENVVANVPVEYAWVRTAGNYLEVHGPNKSAVLVRATLKGFLANAGTQLVRIHRCYAVLPSSVDRIERSHVRMKDGTWLPIGDRFRDHFLQVAKLAPSSQMA